MHSNNGVIKFYSLIIHIFKDNVLMGLIQVLGIYPLMRAYSSA